MLTVATVVFAHNQATLLVWSNSVVFVPLASVRAPVAFCRLFQIGVIVVLGISATTSERNVGAPAEPDVGPEKTVLAVCAAKDSVPLAAIVDVNTVPSATLTATPLDVGKVSVGVEALDGAVIVNFPDAVLLAKAIVPVDVPANPTVKVGAEKVSWVLVRGAVPAPPPRTSPPEASNAEDPHVVAPEKYGIPPEVPATVNAGVVVAVATEINPPVNETLVTVPAAATADVTNAVVARVVLFVPPACVVAVDEPRATGFANVGVPVKAIFPLRVAAPENVPVPNPAPTANVGVPEKLTAPLIVVGVIVPKVWVADHVLALLRAREATTAPVVGDIVRVPSEFETDVTPPIASAAMLPAEMLKFIPLRSIGRRSPFWAGFPLTS